ncbi:MAG: transcriptional regulator [Porphyromonadaceae bacterium CG2_30_38_12]|nr:MAG: transcriptional regulator [Porphyromonadaceae bacterium CG2_30_38_12]
MEKVYYSISEVAALLKMNLSNLRFYEKEFKQLKPKRNDKGTRFYSKDDIQLLKQIKYLIDDKKLTLDGVRQQLNEKKDAIQKQQELVERLKLIKTQLLGIVKELN